MGMGVPEELPGHEEPAFGAAAEVSSEPEWLSRLTTTAPPIARAASPMVAFLFEE
jgi:hypothetical protein